MLVITQHFFNQGFDYLEYGLVSARLCQSQVKFKIGVEKAGNVVAAAADSLDGLMDLLEILTTGPRSRKLG